MPDAVGFIGLGVMGRPMARNLLASGVELHVHSRSSGPVKELVELGADGASTPAEVATRCTTVITMLPEEADVESVLLGESGVLSAASPEALIIDMSTISPNAVRRFGESCEEAGAALLDAPVSGGEKGAIDGSLSVMVGGASENVERAMPLFEAMGQVVIHIGDLGSGQVAKACNQLLVASTIQAVAESLRLAECSGVDAASVRAAMMAGLGSSRILDSHGLRMLNRSFEPGFGARLHLKDARIVLDSALRADAPTPAFQVVAAQLERLVSGGGGELDHSALFALLADA